MRVNLDNMDFGEEENFAQLLDASERNSTSGSLQIGKIIQIDQDRDLAMIALPYSKSESMLYLGEIRDEEGKLLFSVGDEIELYASGSDNRPNVSYTRAQREKKIRQKIEELQGNFQDKIVDAKVIRKNKGGYVMDYDGVDVFLPRRESAFKEGLKVEGKTYKVAITHISPQENTIIVSRKRFFDIDKSTRKEVVEKILASNGIYDAVVKKVTTFGIFTDIDGVEGLVHHTEISHRGMVNPQKNFKVGDHIKIKVLGYDEQKHRLSLSIKALSEDPWKEVEKELEVGYTIKVIVSNIEEYGAFVDLGNDIEGFLHVSEISWDKNIKHPNDYLQVGQELDVEIIEIDSKNRRLRVSLKKLTHKPFVAFTKAHKEGDVLKGKVVTLTDFGAFVNLGVVDGLLHNEDIAWDRGVKCKDVFKVGDEVEVKILKIDTQNERISLSKKLLSDSPAAGFAKIHHVDEIIEGVISEIKDFGIFIKVDNYEVLIKNEDIPQEMKESLKVGDSVKCVVFSIDERANRIRASIRRLQKQQEKEGLRAFNEASEQRMTLGDKVKNRI